MRFSLFVILSALFIQSTAALALPSGQIGSGGGKGVMCDGKVQILDFYELKLRGATLLPAEKDYKSNLVKYGLVLVEYMRTNSYKMSGDQVLSFAHDNIEARVRYIDPNGTLPITEDATLPPMIKGCSVVQIAVWANDGFIYVDNNLWTKLDPQNQAALMLHEYLYSQARETGWQSSDQSRLVIGEVFSEIKIDGKLTPVFKASEYLDCRSARDEKTGEETYFLAINELRDGKRGVGFYFDIIKGQIRQTRTYGFVPEIKITDFVRPGFKDLTVFVQNESLGEKSSLTSNSRIMLSQSLPITEAL